MVIVGEKEREREREQAQHAIDILLDYKNIRKESKNPNTPFVYES